MSVIPADGWAALRLIADPADSTKDMLEVVPLVAWSSSGLGVEGYYPLGTSSLLVGATDDPQFERYARLSDLQQPPVPEAAAPPKSWGRP